MTIEEFSENYEAIWQFLNEKLDMYEWIQLNNVYKFHVLSFENVYYYMEDFNEMMENISPIDIAFKIFFGDGFNPNDDLFSFDAYENLESFNIFSAAEESREYLEWAIEEDPIWFYDQLAYMNYDDIEIIEWLENYDT